MNKMNLTPNEVIGYRLHPDQWNWTVVVVKRHGESSQKAGQEYETPLSYPKDIKSAISYIVNHVSAIEGAKTQQHVFDTTGVVANLEALQTGFDKAKQAALDAVEDLELRLKAAGLDFSSVSKKALATTENKELEAQPQ